MRSREQLHLRQLIIVGVLVPVVFLVSAGAVLLVEIRHLLAVGRWVDRTDRVITDAVAAEKLQLDMETGLRGFTIERDAAFLEPYRRAAPLLDETVARLRRAVDSDRDAAALLDRADGARRAWRGWAEGRIRAVVDDRPDTPRDALAGKAHMDRFRDALGAVVEREQGLRDKRLVAATEAARRTTAIAIGLVFALGGLLAFASAQALSELSHVYGTALEEARARARALVDSEQRFRLLVDGARDYALVFLDDDGRVASWNPGAERLTGWSAGEILGDTLARCVPSDGAAGMGGDLSRARDQGSADAERWLVRKDGERIWVTSVVSALRDERGAVCGFSLLVRDLTERKRAEEERARLGREVEAALRQREDFLVVASHELRTPVCALELRLSALAQILGVREGRADARAVTSIAAIERQVARLTSVIDSMIDASRDRSGPAPVDETDLAEVARAVAVAQRVALERAGCVLTLRTAGRVAGAWERGDLEQIVGNLLSNAIKYGRGRPIELVVERDGDAARIRVSDQGIGIAPADQGRIFERFGRAVSVEHYGGFGLGLWHVRTIVERLGGTIQVHSAPQRGATFVVTLPTRARAGEEVRQHL